MKSTVAALARQVYGSGAYTTARRSICTWWRVELFDSEGRMQTQEEHKSLRIAYARIATRLRARLDRMEAA